MRRAVLRLGCVPDLALIDGNKAPALPCPAQTVVDGDATVPSISAASIVAKVTRDHLMRRLALRYPGYGWEHNVGYATVAHRDAIWQLGVCCHHRRSFASVQGRLL
jgi:ribonuclease HII